MQHSTRGETITSEKSKYLSIVIIFVIGFVYITVKAITIVQKRQISTSDGIYSNRVTISEEMQTKAQELTKGCDDVLCQTQKLLDYVSNIPYYTNRFQAHKPTQTMQLRYGDCDDKSNLLISLLHALDIEAYFVLVPKHIFVIVALNDVRLRRLRKALWIDTTPYYILETTAPNSSIGFPLQYKLKDIEMILDPFENKELKMKSIEWR